MISWELLVHELSFSIFERACRKIEKNNTEGTFAKPKFSYASGGGDEPCVTLLVIMCFCVPNL